MKSRTVGMDASRSGGLYFQTYQKLLKQRERIDRELNKVQSSIFKTLSQTSRASGKKQKQGKVGRPRKKVVYVDRVKSNKLTLIEAIHRSVPKNKELSMKDVLEALKQKKLYKTNSKYFYTMVNNKIHTDETIESVGRGLFVFNPVKKELSTT